MSRTLRFLRERLRSADLDVDPRRPAQGAEVRRHRQVGDVDRVDRPHVDLARDAAEVPPAAAAVRTPVREVGVAAPVGDPDHQPVAPLPEAVHVDLEGHVAGTAGADLLAVQPYGRPVVHRLEADDPAPAPAVRRPRQLELLAVPADALRVQLRVAAVPGVGDRGGAPAHQRALGEVALRDALELVVLAEVPGAAEPEPVGLALADVQLLARLLDLQLGSRRGRGRRRGRRRARGSATAAGLSGGGAGDRGQRRDGECRCESRQAGKGQRELRSGSGYTQNRLRPESAAPATVMRSIRPFP